MKTGKNSTFLFPDLNTPGSRLKRCVNYAGITQKELGKVSGYSPQTISKICQNRQPLELHHAVTFAQILKVRQEYLLMESPYMTTKEMYANILPDEVSDNSETMHFIESLGYKICNSSIDSIYMETPSKVLVAVPKTDLKRTIKFIRGYVEFYISDFIEELKEMSDE